MTDYFSTPDDLGDIRQSDLQASLGQRLGAQAADAVDAKDSLSGMYLFRRAREADAGGADLGVGAGGDLDVYSTESLEQRQAVFDAQRAAIPDTSIADAKARVKQEGLEGHLKLPDQPSIKSPVLDLMIAEAHERRDRELAIAQGPQGFMPGALGLVTSLGAGMIDPVNMAAFSIPVLGEARAGRLLASAGDSIFARAGARAIEGGLQGAAGTALLQPADWWLHTRDGQDYTMADALKSIVMGAGMGAGFHAGFGAVGDLRAKLRGAPLKGSPEDLMLRGLMGGTHVSADQLTDAGVPIGEVPGIVPSPSPALAGEGRGGGEASGLAEPPPPQPSPASGRESAASERPFPGDVPLHPAEVLADLPPAAREDAFRATVADMSADRPARGGDVLAIAADHDPRIAESFEAFHGSPWNFDRFDASHIDIGEGAQAYGHGLYFAEHPDVATEYQRRLALSRLGPIADVLPEYFKPGNIVSGYGGRDRVLEFERGAQPWDFRVKVQSVDAKGEASGRPRWHSTVPSAAEVKQALGRLPGNLYKVRIGANQDHFLDWDKPIGEQHEVVRAGLKKAGWDVDRMADRPGSEIVRQFEQAVAPAHAASKLSDAGIPGIKYLDQGSRGGKDATFAVKAKDGSLIERGIHDENFAAERAKELGGSHEIEHHETRNFVVFDDKHIEITHKNGEAVGLDQFKSSPEAQAATPAVEAGPHIPDLTQTVKPKPRGRAAAHPDTLSLNEHLASQGGLRPDPELRAIYGGDRGPFVPGFGPLIRKSGMGLDEALRSAKDHGYMSDPHDIDNGTPGAGGRTSHGLTPNDLLDRLDAENRGQKQYKPSHVEKTKYDPEQEKHVIMGALETELDAAGEDVSAIDPKLLDRTVEIVHREGVSDVMDAYERAIMEDEERYNAIADARRANPATADIPGFDDGRAAPGDGGRDQAGNGQAGRPDAGGSRADDSQPSSHGARAAAAATDPRWRELADVRPAEQDPEVLDESRAADRLAEPDSLKPESSLTALEKQAADAEAIWRKMEPTLTEKERALVNDVLDQLKLDKEARDKIISDGAACLAAAVV